MRDPGEVQKVVATAVSLVVGLSDNMQITFQSGFEGDETDEAVNARLDRLVALANRQKAIASIPALQDDLLKQKDTLAQFQEDLARVNADHDRIQAERCIELDERIAQRADERKKFEAEINGAILQMQQKRQDTWNAGAAEHARSGRVGSYVPKGQVQTNLAKIDQAVAEAISNREKALEDFDRTYQEGIDTARSEIQRADEERSQAVRNLEISVKRYEDAIATSTEKLDKALEAAGR